MSVLGSGLVTPAEAPNYCAELRTILDHLPPDDIETVEVRYGGDDPERARYVDSILLRLRERRRG